MTLAEFMLDLITTAVASLPIKVFVGDVSESVNYQFIDEIFHYPQLKRIVSGDYTYYHPKLTTPPGLYYLTYAYLKLSGQDCSLENVRYFNFIGGLLIALMVVLIRYKTYNPGFTTISIFLNPLLTIYYSIYYTDVWSTAVVIASYTIAVWKPYNNYQLTANLAALVGFLSLFFRQTNIIWCMFILASLIDAKTQEEKLYKNQSFFEDIKIFIKSAINNWSLSLPFVFVAGLFTAFVVKNGGITLGDQENHDIVPHLAQLCYCATFITVFTLPLWISISFIFDYLGDNFFSVSGLFFNAACLPILYLIVQEFTIIHPFIRADNRHYTFYLVRAFITRTETSRLQLIPVYHFCFYVVYKLFTSSIDAARKSQASLVMFCVFAFCTAATIVPSPLFEPRYYILPFIFFRLFIVPYGGPILDVKILRTNNRAIRFVLEGLWYWFWSQALYLLFLQFTFQWEDIPEPQRVIW